MIPNFPVLYKKNNAGRIMQWNVCVLRENDPSENYVIEVQFGELGGAIQKHRTLITEGKVKRTICQQAVLEAQSKWNHKHLREVYRDDLDQVRTSSCIDNTFSSTTSFLDETIRPMLAQTYDPIKKSKGYSIPFPCYVQRKYDGVRCFAYLNEDRSSVILESRTGIQFQLFDELKSQIYDCMFQHGTEHHAIVWDGELYTPDIPFEILSGFVRITKAKATEEKLKLNAQIGYHIYDFYDGNNPSMPFKSRFEKIFTLPRNVSSTLIYIVATELAMNMDAIRLMHDVYVSEGFEGIILRDPKGPYEPNKRSKYLQKFKSFLEDEFEIIGFTDGVGIESGLIIFQCKIPDSELVFSVRPRGSHEYRRQLFQQGSSLVGKSLTVIYQEKTLDGMPRFPVGKSIREE